MRANLSIKTQLHILLFSMHLRNGPTKIFQLFFGFLIVANAMAVVLETVSPVYLAHKEFFIAFELISVAIFSLEYIARLWAADLSPEYSQPIIGRFKYALTPMALVDLASILPSVLLISGFDLRILRVMRLIRLVKLTRYSRAANIISSAVKSKKDELLFSGIIMLALLIISAVLVYFAEHEAQPQAFSSIPATLWWGVVTLTTIGYGDIYPITLAGKTIASIASAVGIGLFALPGGIIAAALIEQARQSDKHSINCPHCGKQFER